VLLRVPLVCHSAAKWTNPLLAVKQGVSLQSPKNRVILSEVEGPAGVLVLVVAFLFVIPQGNAAR
jgi:hypothetical protein